jgi:glycosyltransferase involved in cell wall biosynthesis
MAPRDRVESRVAPSVALFFPVGALEVTPVVKQLARGLAESGFAVDLFTVRNRCQLPPEAPHPGVRMNIHPHELTTLREPVPRTTLRFCGWVLPICMAKRYSIYVAAGVRGLVVAAALSSLTRVPFIYHCLELYPAGELHSLASRLYKQMERWANRRAACTLIQDDLRARILSEDNGVPAETLLQFPVSAFGPARRVPNDSLRAMFNIAPEDKVILCAGAIRSAFVPSEELIAAAQHWPPAWRLVLHSNIRLQPHEREELRALDKASRVLFSDDPLPYGQLGRLIAGADVGLALYRRSDGNIYNLGLSSGKLAEYARAGLPLVVSDFPGIRERVERSRCGVNVANMIEVAPALAKIFADYDTFSRNSCQFFERELALENFMPAVAARVASLTASR